MGTINPRQTCPVLFLNENVVLEGDCLLSACLVVDSGRGRDDVDCGGCYCRCQICNGERGNQVRVRLRRQAAQQCRFNEGAAERASTPKEESEDTAQPEGVQVATRFPKSEYV